MCLSAAVGHDAGGVLRSVEREPPTSSCHSSAASVTHGREKGKDGTIIIWISHYPDDSQQWPLHIHRALQASEAFRTCQ